MAPNEKFGLLRNILKTLGLSAEATDDIVDRISDFLTEKEPKAAPPVFPYHLRDDFVSKAEHRFYMVLKSIVPDSAVVLAKVSQCDLFYVKSGDNGEFSTYTTIPNKALQFKIR